MLTTRRFLLFAVLMLTVRMISAEQTPAADLRVDRAIDAVYPALVRIHVVVSDYQGGRAQRFESAGSGVIISADGYVVTNHHVAGKATSIRCVLTSRQEVDATLIGTDPLTDISVLKLNLADLPALRDKLPFARFGSSESLRVGDPVLAMGCPLALSQSVTKGIVSNKELIFSQRFIGPMILDGEDVGLLVKWIAHDAQILPGNSGGPLVNLQGEIVGINEINLGGFGGGLGGAIPSELTQSVVQQLIEKGHISRCWVGAEFQPLLKGMLQDRGVLLSTVIPDSPAEKAGLKPGDIIESINGTPVHVRFREELPPLN
ncbi:MAG TPA: trypsin-like peptidase domain-containing protein, partial [Acidobacteriota bacterium]|nr:trypsin-like peptidase domain-containing protein [Acidobacteriota bacterium]